MFKLSSSRLWYILLGIISARMGVPLDRNQHGFNEVKNINGFWMQWSCGGWCLYLLNSLAHCHPNIAIRLVSLHLDLSTNPTCWKSQNAISIASIVASIGMAHWQIITTTYSPSMTNKDPKSLKLCWIPCLDQN